MSWNDDLWDGLFPSDVPKIKIETCKGVTCPYCQQPAQRVTGATVYPHLPKLHGKMYWLCMPCEAYVGCHEAGAFIGKYRQSDGTVPMGHLANATLRRLKSRAHEAFDPLWKDKHFHNRAAAYKWLADKMHLSFEECHIGFFNERQCNRVIHVCEEFLHTKAPGQYGHSHASKLWTFKKKT